MKSETILVTGANGQIGSVLCEKLRNIYGNSNVLATDIRPAKEDKGPFELCDILDKERLFELVDTYRVTQIYHLAAILSAKGEIRPLPTWHINMNGLFNVLEVARDRSLTKVFYPSSIAVFGDQAPVDQTPQFSYLNPSTVYGISKQSGELWAKYYYEKYDLDIRSLRYPGIISYQSNPGGGTTDYAVDIFHYAVKNEAYECFLKEDTFLPMVYMPDAIEATLQLMEAPSENILIRTSYNIGGMSFSPLQLTREIQKHIPDFKVVYKPDFRQQIADTWSNSIDDAHAKKDWNWNPNYDLSSMTKDMIVNLRKKYEIKIR